MILATIAGVIISIIFIAFTGYPDAAFAILLSIAILGCVWGGYEFNNFQRRE